MPGSDSRKTERSNSFTSLQISPRREAAAQPGLLLRRVSRLAVTLRFGAAALRGGSAAFGVLRGGGSGGGCGRGVVFVAGRRQAVIDLRVEIQQHGVHVVDAAFPPLHPCLQPPTAAHRHTCNESIRPRSAYEDR